MKVGLRNKPRSNIGFATRRSTATKAASIRPATTSSVTIKALLQPSLLPRMRAKMRQNSAVLNVITPRRSTPPWLGSRVSRTLATEIHVQSAPIGTLTKKIHSQPIPSTSAPPTSGPIATARPVVAPQMPNAVARSRPSNSWARRASEVANIAAPPMPWRPRARSSIVGVVEKPQSSEAATNSTRPPAKISRRP